MQSKRFTGSPPFQMGRKAQSLAKPSSAEASGTAGLFLPETPFRERMHNMIRHPADVDRERSRANDRIFQAYNLPAMAKSAAELLNEQFLEMRWRALSLAADFDRIERAPGGKEIVNSDPRLAQLRDALKTMLQSEPASFGRAAKVQIIFSDMSPPAPRGSK
jgi:hypothetical protein